jgi:RES domain-containing protein
MFPISCTGVAGDGYASAGRGQGRGVAVPVQARRHVVSDDPGEPDARRRIGDPDGKYPIFDATGARLSPGRWNNSGSPVIYASEHDSTAVLEKLVRIAAELPPNQHFIQITIPNGMSYEILNPAHLPGWNTTKPGIPQTYGETWQTSRRSLMPLVPNVVARMELNVLINPEHAEFPRITHSLHRAVWWDRRLFCAQ